MFQRKNKSKKWLKKTLKKGKKIAVPVNCEVYIHESDKKALAGLKVIPFFDKICAAFISAFNEPLYEINDMSSKIRITQKQLPRIYNMVENICKKLGIEEMPRLYLELNRYPNAYTYGNKTVAITITSGLLECMEDDEIYAVLAHECGHIACKHVLYHTMGSIILNGGALGLSFLDGSGLIGKLVTAPLKLAFYRWMRCSEFSADRAAAICCEESTPVVETMMRLAGGTTHIDCEIGAAEFVSQSVEYKGLIDEKKSSKFLEFLMFHNDTHPLLSVRAFETVEWCKSRAFQESLEQLYN